MRTTDPQISFADLEFIKQGVRLEPTLKAIADFLDQHGAIIQRVRRDLVRGLKKPTTGRMGVAAAGAPFDHPCAREELGLSGTARTYCRWLHAATLHRLQ